MRALIQAEWTKFRTVPGWVIGMAIGGVLIVAFGLLPGIQGSCGQPGSGSECVLPVGPEGQEVSDGFMFVHRPLSGDGSITARVASMTGMLPPGPNDDKMREGVAPWAKAGLLIKDGTTQGSAYAAVMLTGAHGVRLQHNFVHDKAGKPGPPGSARWLRLTRTKEKITAEESADGTTWTTVGTVTLAGLPQTVQIGLFVTSPQHAEGANESLGSFGSYGGPTMATAVFDHVTPVGSLTGTRIGGPANKYADELGGFEETGEGVFTITGTGDIAPAVGGPAGIGASISDTLLGTFAGLIMVVVISTMFVTAEYRRGMMRTTLAASPRRGRVLVAKAAVVGAVSFVVGVLAAAVVITLGQKVLRDNGAYVHLASTATELRVIVGTGVLLGVTAMLAVGLGALLRRGTTAVTVAIVTTALPYLLVMSVLPPTAGQWLLRIAPAAAFSMQQSLVEYEQVANLYLPVDGYFPLSPLAGGAVLAGWAVAALVAAACFLRRRDA
ncbi:ABC transporter permease subunit [Allorhizocola rhizosphaerae]|uniref:ABC transporter permease subunit n=1 Tax=Allorhizocola rhizosphaerae TaxID=1872709 RepID=UPI000E3D60CE|nr:ABC transporter permease subunit [Allorhizocola rhizosphaerae]